MSGEPDQGLIGTWSDADTRLPDVLRALDRLRRGADRTASRAAVVNLVVVAAVDAAADRVVASVAGLGAHHPGRIVVLVPEGRADGDGDTPDLAARVELRESDVEGRHLWWEVVVLQARGPVRSHLESLTEPLLLHDLPVALWLAGGTSTVESSAVVDDAHQLIVSGERAAAAGGDVAADIGRLLGRKPVADLAWLALEPSRRAVARLFEAPARREALARGALRVSGPPWSSRLLAAWLIERSGLEPGRVELVADTTPGGPLRAEIELGGVRAALDAGDVWPAGAAGAGPPPVTGPGVARARLDGEVAAVPHGGAETPRLLAMALTRPGRDRRYEAAVAVAGRF